MRAYKDLQRKYIDNTPNLTLVSHEKASLCVLFSPASKRCFDILGSLLAITMLVPVMLIVAILVKITSPGPILYKQERLTQGKRHFNIIKFRTMVWNAEDETGPTWELKNDHRVTPIGKFLRNTHLDEIPQFFNVLIGDMSIVGPRPERPVFVEKFEKEIPDYNKRFAMKAGLASLSHVIQRCPTIEEIGFRTILDQEYIKNWSHTLDSFILLQTARIVFVAFINQF